MPEESFIARWRRSGAAERANYQGFLIELCDYLGVPRPMPTQADERQNQYVFEKAVEFRHATGLSSVGRIDLYKRGCFVLEAKQGSDATPKSEQASLLLETHRKGTAVRESPGWDQAMLRARNQAEQYAKALPVEDGWPPFLVIVDVGYSIELFADFSGTGKAYLPFPDSLTHRTPFDRIDFARDRLRAVWTDPLSLDPSRVSAKVTRDVAALLADLAKSLERDYPPERVTPFLMRCIFTFFAEDIRLLRENSFTELLQSLRGDLGKFQPMVESLWETMDRGGFSPILREQVLRFNGGLFASHEALLLNREQHEILCRAGAAEWKDVEPSIFGTLLERALDASERHALGAHYTPRAYVERLVIPTVVEPLRQDWADVQAAAAALVAAKKSDEAIVLLREFRQKLCNTLVLDPACGSGNFLYVTFEHLKRLEAEVNDMLEGLGYSQQLLQETGVTVDPHQLLGIELNPRAAAITDLVLWIGYLQWYFRTWGASTMPREPVIERFHNIEYRDALLAYDPVEPALDEEGRVRKTWDGKTMVRHPVTGAEVPDEHAQRIVLHYPNARKSAWPKVDFIVGNPPFLGNWRMRGELGDGYAETLREVYDEVPETADYVMYWWHRAAERVRAGETRRFGFITTNSLRQTFQRRVMVPHLADAKTPLSLVFAVPDHPWVDSMDGAAVRIAMTVGAAGTREGRLLRVIREEEGDGEGAAKVELEERLGKILPDLSVGPDTTTAGPLKANVGLSCPGVKLHGAGFIVSRDRAADLGLGSLRGLENHIREYRNGRDLTARPRGVMVIDLFGLEATEVRDKFPAVYQHVFEHVKPEREGKRGETKDSQEYAKKWWIFGKPRNSFRPALKGLLRYIATAETAKHRVFVFLDGSILPDNMLVNIASSDAYLLGVLSSRIHVAWALAAGGTLEDRPRYNKTRCFEPFPFPAATEVQKGRIRELAEKLDGHRKERQRLHTDLTMTEMYNVLEKLRRGEALDAKDQQIHEQGIVSVLRELHDEIDEAVEEAYGWPTDLATEEILFRLVELNAARAAEERAGLVRWLRPEFQQAGAAQVGLGIEAEEEEVKSAKTGKTAWPDSLPERVRAVRDYLRTASGPSEVDEVAKRFARARKLDVKAILETLAALGQARVEGSGYWA